MSNRDDDNNLEEYLSGNSELSRLYTESTDAEMPSLDLDNSILAAAKREVLAGPQKSKKTYSPFSNNYLIPISTAASMLIVVAVVSFFPSEQAVEQSFDLNETDMDVASIVLEQEVIKPQEQKISEVVAAKSSSYSAKLNAPVAKSKKKIARKGVGKVSEKIIKLRLHDKPLSLKKEQQQSEELQPAKLRKRQDVVGNQGLIASTKLDIKADRQRITETQTLNHDSSIEDKSPASSPATEPTGLFSALAVVRVEYNEEQWNKFSEGEWLTRIRKIHHQRGDKAVKKIIIRFKKKFPASKIDFKQLLNSSSNKK